MKTLIAILIIVVVVLILLGLLLSRQRKRATLRHSFGPEYDRVVERSHGRQEAHQHLEQVAERHDQLDLRDLSPEQATGYRTRWDAVQARFVDDPSGAVDDADGLVTDVMRSRGYPVQDFEERASLVSVDHPAVVEHYRAAHAAHARHRSAGSGDAAMSTEAKPAMSTEAKPATSTEAKPATSTEELRLAFTHYRSLFDELVGSARRAR